MKKIFLSVLTIFIFAGVNAGYAKNRATPENTPNPQESARIYLPIESFEVIKIFKTLSGHSDAVNSITFSPDKRLLATGSGDNTAMLWDVATGKKLQTLSGHSNRVYSVAFSPNGRLLATGSFDKTAMLWDIATGKRLQTLSGHSGGVRSIAFSPNGTLLATGSWDKTAILWDVATGKRLQILSGHSEGVYSVAFSPDKRLLATGSGDNTAMLWDIATGKRLQTLSGHSEGVYSVAFSPNKRLLATGSADNTAMLWDVATGKRLQTMSGHSAVILSVAFSPDGTLLATGSGDKTAMLWDVATGKRLQTLSGHSKAVNSIAFSPDKRLLATGSLDNTAMLWENNIGLFSKVDNVPTLEAERDGKIRAIAQPKGEFETTREYEARKRSAEIEKEKIEAEYETRIKAQRELDKKTNAKLYPVTLNAGLDKYNADKEGFEANISGQRVFIPVARGQAIEISKHKDDVKVKGMVRRLDAEKVELLNAFLVDNATNERFAFGAHEDAVMMASSQKAPPELVISSIALSEPSGNGMLDAGETGVITAIIKNIGKGAGFGVNLDLDDRGLAGIRLSEKTYVGTINPGEEKRVSAEISALEEIRTADVSLKATLVESNGFDSKPIILAFKTKELMPPLLQIARVEIEDAEGKRTVTKGKESQITLTVQNAGSGSARGVLASIKSWDKEIKLFGESEIAIGTLGPGESKKAAFSIAVTQRYNGEKVLPVSFIVKEERERFSVKPGIRLSLNEEAPDVKVVKVEAREAPLVKTENVENIDSIPAFGPGQRVIGDNDVAVVIGIERYQSIPKSDYSYTDAKLVKGYLAALGFKERNIEFITDEKATQSSIKKTLETWLPNRIKANGKAVIYYSGHGAPDPKTGDAYIVPFDGDPNYLEDTGYSLKRLYDRLGRLEAKEVIVLLDSCFSGAGGRSVLAKGARPLVMMTEGLIMPQNLALLSATQGTQISTSSPEKGHGIFTYYLLKALKDGKKDVAEIYEYVKPLVEDEAKQLNVRQSPSINPDVEKLKGKFGLRR